MQESLVAKASSLEEIVMKVGTFDEKNFGRDRTPDTGVNGLARGLVGESAVSTPFRLDSGD